MKDVNVLTNECINELESIGLKDELETITSVTVNSRAKGRFGRVLTRRNRSTGKATHSITISSEILQDCVDDKAVKNTIMHELLHCTRDGNNHAVGWKRLANIVNRKLGYNITRTNKYSDFGLQAPAPREDYKYEIVCSNCGEVIGKRKRRSNVTSKYVCGKCKGKLIMREI